MEDFELMVETEKRLADGGPFYSADEVMKKLGISQTDLDAVEDVEIE
jgi:hypothetical protein